MLRAPGVPLPPAAVLPQRPCQRLYNLPSILIRFPTSPPAHSSPNAGAGRSHDMVSNQLLDSDSSWLSSEEALHSLCLVLPEQEQGAALRSPSKLRRRQAMLAPQGVSGSAPRAEAAGRPYRNTALFGAGHLQEHHQRPPDPATCGRVGAEAGGLPAATRGRRVLGLPCGAAVLCRRCCAAGAVPAAPGKHQAPLLLLLFSRGWFCVAPGGPGGRCGSWAPCPTRLSWRGSTAAGALLGLAPSPAPGPRRQRVVALSEARGCKHFPALPSPN